MAKYEAHAIVLDPDLGPASAHPVHFTVEAPNEYAAWRHAALAIGFWGDVPGVTPEGAMITVEVAEDAGA